MLNPDYKREAYQRPFDDVLVGKKSLIGVEVGVYKGQHAREMLERLDIKQLMLVDPWEDYEEYTDKRIKKQIEIALVDAKKLLESFEEKLLWVKNYSVEAAKKVKDNKLDFVYIDGNHDYEYVKKDIEVWYPKLKKGGLFGGHDYLKDFSGVIKAVDEFVKMLDLVLMTRWGEEASYYSRTGARDWWVVR